MGVLATMIFLFGPIKISFVNLSNTIHTCPKTECVCGVALYRNCLHELLNSVQLGAKLKFVSCEVSAINMQPTATVAPAPRPEMMLT